MPSSEGKIFHKTCVTLSDESNRKKNNSEKTAKRGMGLTFKSIN